MCMRIHIHLLMLNRILILTHILTLSIILMLMRMRILEDVCTADDASPPTAIWTSSSPAAYAYVADSCYSATPTSTPADT